MQTLFSNQLELAHHFWEQILMPGDCAIDATVGNGHDTLKLAQIVGPQGEVFGIDLQSQAIENTFTLLKGALNQEQLYRVHLFNQSHSSFPPIVYERKIKLIVYNLGYLPGSGDKTFTTLTETTLESINNSLNLLSEGGVISIMCYPGHKEGQKEEKALLSLVSALDQRNYNISYHQWLNRRNPPSLLLIKKKNTYSQIY